MKESPEFQQEQNLSKSDSLKNLQSAKDFIPGKRMILVLISSIFFSELLIMLIGRSLKIQLSWFEGPIDSLLLTILIFPAIYFLVIRPMTIQNTERKQAEAKLLAEHAFRNSIELSLSSGIVIVDDKGCQTYVNPSFCKLFGWSEEELTGKTAPFVYWPTDQLQSINEAFQLTLANKAPKEGFELEFVRKDGVRIPAQVIITPFSDGKQRIGWMANVIDITERKQADEALRESEERLNFHVNNSPLASIEWNTDFIVTRWSYEAEKIFGWNQSETIGKPIMDLQMIYDEDIPIVQKTMERLTDGSSKYVVSTNRNYTKFGKVIICEWYNSVLINPQGKMISVMSSVMDITERKRIEKELHESEQMISGALEFNRKILYTSSIGILTYKNSGQCVSANSAAARVGGTTVDQLLAQNFHEIPSWKKSGMYQVAIRALDTGIEQLLEVHLVSTFGKEGWFALSFSSFESQGERHLLVFTSDITERKQASDALQKSELKYRTILQTTMDGFWIVDFQGHFTEINDTYCKLIGYTREELLGMRIQDVEVLETEYDIEQRIQRLIKNGSDRFETKHHCKDGRVVDVEISIHCLPDEKNIFVFLRDISERKLADEALKQSHEVLFKLSEQVPGVIYQYRLYPDGRSCFPYSSFGMNDIYEYSPNDVREDATPVFSRLHPDDLQRVSDLIIESARTLQHFHCEFRVVLPRQGLRWRYSDAMPERLEDNSTLWHGIIYDITELKDAVKEINNMKESLEKLNHRLDEIRENERAIISREIHDQLGQSLTALKIDLTWLSGKITGDSEESAKLKGMIELVSATSKDIQRISSELRPPILDDLGLAAALEWYCEEFANRTGLRVQMDLDDVQAENMSKNLTIYRVLQESLTNIIRHAGAQNVQVKLSKIEEDIVLIIQDDGIGISPDKIKSSKSLGLLGMFERVKQSGGHLEITASKTGGTDIRISIPIN